MRLKAFELIARCAEQGFPVLVVDTLRTPEEQAALLAKGVSWTKNSRHLLGQAIDVAPYEQFLLHGSDRLAWNADEPAWKQIGLIGESLGLVWGGRWGAAGGRAKPDLGHFEWKD